MGEVHPIRDEPIVVDNLRRVDKGALIGFFDLEVVAWHLVLRDCKWFAKDGNEWIGLPSSSYTNKEGKTVWKNLVEFNDKRASDRFQAAVLRVVKTAPVLAKSPSWGGSR